MSEVKRNQLFRDPSIKPTNESLSEALKELYLIYNNYLKVIKECEIIPEWKYYNDGKTWLQKGVCRWQTSRGTLKEKTIYWLSIEEYCIKVSFFVNEKRWEEIKKLNLLENTRAIIDKTTKYGKLKFYPLVIEIDSNNYINDLKKIILFQKEA